MTCGGQAERVIGALALVVLLLFPVVSVASPQSLGEAAARERQRREALTRRRGPSRVLTEKEANPAGAWRGWRDWQPRDGTFTIRMPSRPIEQADEAEPAGTSYTLQRAYYHARDEFGSEYWVSVTEYPADYVRFQSFRIWAGFPASSLLPYSRSDSFVRRADHLGGLPVTIQFGSQSQIVGVLVGTRYYELLATAPPGEPFHGRELHPFFESFRP